MRRRSAPSRSLSAQNRTVNVVVVDVDRFGIQFLRDLRTVFPTCG